MHSLLFAIVHSEARAMEEEARTYVHSALDGLTLLDQFKRFSGAEPFEERSKTTQMEEAAQNFARAEERVRTSRPAALTYAKVTTK
jgi:hypothetical protein